MNTGQLVSYDESKIVLCKLFNHSNPDNPTFTISFLASIFASGVITLTGLPFDLVKSRL